MVHHEGKVGLRIVHDSRLFQDPQALESSRMLQLCVSSRRCWIDIHSVSQVE